MGRPAIHSRMGAKPARRVRRTSSGNVIVRRHSHRNECYSALLPVLVIAAVWCFGCYIYVWVSLFRSFARVHDDGDQFSFNKREDVLAIKLEQFLAGGSSRDDQAPERAIGTGLNESNVSSAILQDILTNPAVQEQIQSTLVSRTGYPNLVLGAYLEPPLPLEETNGSATERMKLREHTPQNLTYASYPYKLKQSGVGATYNSPDGQGIGACSQQGAQWIFPTMHSKSQDAYFEGNVFKKRPNFEKRWELALGVNGKGNNSGKGSCPVDADPFLPWIHDAFPSSDGEHIEFIISNKRRCNTDSNRFQPGLNNLEPQVALLQPVPVRRLNEMNSEKMIGVLNQLWSPGAGSKQAMGESESFIVKDDTYNPPRYVLGTSLDDADEDGKYTRFICRFHTITPSVANGESELKQLVLGESLSTYPYNPEHANYRKRGSNPMLTPSEKGHDEQVWNSVYTVKCPVPDIRNARNDGNGDGLAKVISSGKSVFRDSPLLYLDLIPIRTPTRILREGFGVPGVSSPFDPKLVWGENHVLPRVEASGRWTNIPICRPPQLDEASMIDSAAAELTVKADSSPDGAPEKKHFLVACVWASQSFATRGQTTDTDTSTSDRLREFLVYHTHIAGFDHVYVYDNSLADDNLEAVTAGLDKVTRIPWPHRVCNNNRPMHANPGERSSQYAAENSCRARYGPDTTWMASLDVDEYLIATGKQWGNIRHWLENVATTEPSTKILSFFQTRALPNVDIMVPYEGTATCKGKKGASILNSTCLMKDPKKTFMDTYNCEPTTHPKPQEWAWRGKKQIYSPDFVLNHFVHYSVVTRLILEKPLETSLRFYERAPFERRVDEISEVSSLYLQPDFGTTLEHYSFVSLELLKGFLLHTKTTGPDKTLKWQETCLRKGANNAKNPCKVGIASETMLGGEANHSATGSGHLPSSGFESNCYRHARVMREWVPKLESALNAGGRR
ncbi:hypothetical protein ACHAWF_012195 [Thalassiosira exigua]